MIMMVGLPGSGKSTFAKEIRVRKYISDDLYIPSCPFIHSSDAIRKELYGDESIQDDPQKVFSELHRRIKTDLGNGFDVVYDATNISKKRRIAFLSELKNIRCCPVCVVMAVPFSICMARNSKRERNVPADVLSRMLRNYEPPHYSEGFRYIHYDFSAISADDDGGIHTIDNYFKRANPFDQENGHHSLTLGEHSTKAAEYIQMHDPDNFNLLIASMLHDNGKLYTKTRRNSRGEDDGNCHYYQHHCVGAYYSMFYLISDDNKFSENDITYITNLIYYHMHPYRQWHDSERVKKRDYNLLGRRIFKDIMLLHEADVNAH